MARLFSHLGCITYDDNRGEVRRYVLLCHSLNLLGGDCVDAVAVSVEIIARQVEHLDAHKLIDQAILSFDADWKDTAKVGLRVRKLFVGYAFAANTLQLKEKLAQRSLGDRRAHLGGSSKGPRQPSGIEVRVRAIGITLF